MREIKFRAIGVDNGEWVYGSLLVLNSGFYIVDTDYYNSIIADLHQKLKINALWEDNDFKKVNENTIGQFTGLYDKNGKEIYEGDIVKLESGFFEGIYNVVKIEENECYCVYYDNKNARYDLKTQDDNLEFKRIAWAQLVEEKVEIMGNCYDNQELLKGE